MKFSQNNICCVVKDMDLGISRCMGFKSRALFALSPRPTPEYPRRTRLGSKRGAREIWLGNRNLLLRLLRGRVGRLFFLGRFQAKSTHVRPTKLLTATFKYGKLMARAIELPFGPNSIKTPRCVRQSIHIPVSYPAPGEHICTVSIRVR
jgi:hypothetical protein